MQAAPSIDAVIIGLGDSGLAAANYLADQGYSLAVMDSRDHPPQAAALQALHPQIEVRTGGFHDDVLARAREIIVSPGVDTRAPIFQHARARGQELIGEIELFARAVTAPVIAITGSNGKSTVTRMVDAMARAANIHVATGGNLGPAALTLLADQPQAELFILELSSFQLETVKSLRPLVAAVLNLTPDHLDRYDSMADYAAAKACIFNHAGHAVLHADQHWVEAMAPAAATQHWFAANADRALIQWHLAMHQGELWLAHGAERLLPCAALPVVGRHNALNALAALAIGAAAGWPMAAMLEGLRGFTPLPHRSESLGVVCDRLWVNDSKATNVASAVAAVEGMNNPVVLLAGGDGKSQDFAALADAMALSGRAAVVFGKDAPRLEQALSGRVDVTRVSDLRAAVAMALEVSHPGDAVVLAPACASLDQFADYRARGDHFRALVEGLKHG